MKRLLFLSSLTGLLLQPSKASSEHAWKELRLTAFGHSSALDPYTTQSPNVSDLSWLYADGLVGASVRGPVALVCKAIPSTSNGLVTDSGRSVTYDIRGDVVWHDGRPFLAQDVVDAFNRAKSGGWGSNRPYALVRQVRAIDTRRVIVDLREADPMFPISFFAAYGEPSLALVRPGRLPIGTGPFAIRGYSNATGAYELRRWHSSPRGQSKVNSISYKFLPDQNTAAIGFASGESDIALYLPHQFVESRHLAYARYTGGAVVLFANVSGTLANSHLRHLVWLAIDREAVRSKVFGNWGLPADSLVSPDLTGSFRFPNSRASHNDIRREIASAFPTRVRLTYASIPGLGDRIGLFLQAQLNALGIDLEIKSFSPQEYFALNGPLHSGRFDLALDVAPYARDPDLASKYSCAAVNAPGENFSRFCDPQLDRAIAHNNFSQVMELLWQNAIVMPLAQIVNCIGLGPRVKSFHVQNYVPVTYFCNEWSLK